MIRLTHVAATLASLFVVSSLIPAKAAETFEIAYTAAPSGRYPAGNFHKDVDGSFVVTGSFGGKGAAGGVFRVGTNGVISHLGSFYGAEGAIPSGGVMKATDGNFYGTTEFGGSRDAGTIFRMSPEGTVTRLANFTDANGRYPRYRLVEGSNGLLYGTTPNGGSADKGTVFKVTKAGMLTVVHHFTAFVNPSGLAKGSDGHFYGVTAAGGTSNMGTVFRVAEAGAFSTLADFNGTNGNVPVGGLTLGSDGKLYGATAMGGANGRGVFYRINNDAIEVLAHVDAAMLEPATQLVEGAPGEFYGVCGGSGVGGPGSVFKATAGSVTKVVDFPVDLPASNSTALVFGNDGALYGAVPQGGSAGVGAVFRVTTGGTFSIFASFGNANGSGYRGNLVKGADGSLYGTSVEGGAQDYGTFFKVDTAGVYSKLGDFDAALGRPTVEPLVLGEDGNFYGTSRNGQNGGGIFRATPAGVLSSVVSFDQLGNSNAESLGLTLGSDGRFYGVLNFAGTGSKGIIYRYDSEDGLSSIYELGSFGETAPSGAAGPLVEGDDGAFYGASYAGGTKNFGAIYRVTPTGQFTVLANFSGSNGSLPAGSLVRARDGNFYGMTITGGLSNAGVIYRVTPAGKLNVITHFTGGNGAFPLGGLVSGPGGNLYGVAGSAGSADRGVLFKVTLAGKLTVIKHFDGETTGAFPLGKLAFGGDANLYGTTYNTIFRLVLNNQPPVAQNDQVSLPAYGVAVLKNDSDVDGDPLEIVEVTQGEHGTVVLNDNNTITYLPSETFTTADTFTYKVSDGINPPVEATVNMTYPEVLIGSVKGLYAGIISDSNGVPVGYWSIAATPGGTFSSSIRLNGKRFSSRHKPQIADNRIDYHINAKNGLPALTIGADLDPGRNLILGTISDGTQTYTMRLERVFPSFTKKDPTPRAGRYTMLLPASSTMVGVPGVPQGTGYAVMNVNGLGIISMAGKMGDGTPFATASFVTREDNFPFYAQLYGKTKGYLTGLATFTPGQISEGSAELIWNKPAQGGLNYPAGFTVAPGFVLSRYQRPAKGEIVIPIGVAPFGNATLGLVGLGINKTLNINAQNRVSIPFAGPDRLSVVINPGTGFFSGKFIHPQDGLRRTFSGAVIQNQVRGEGTYFGIDGDVPVTGKVELAPLE